jgi:hypothetical protein
MKSSYSSDVLLQIAFEESPTVLADYPHLIAPHPSGLLSVIRQVTGRSVALWPLSPFYERNGREADRAEYYPMRTWATSRNQRRISAKFYTTKNYLVIDAFASETKLRNMLQSRVGIQLPQGRRLYQELGGGAYREVPRLVATFGWVGFTFYPDNLLLAFVASRENALLVEKAKVLCEKRGIDTSWMTSSRGKVCWHNAELVLLKSNRNPSAKTGVRS